jgi:FKBP-type peptidyl-prolyl cis-trans isomerase
MPSFEVEEEEGETNTSTATTTTDNNNGNNNNNNTFSSKATDDKDDKKEESTFVPPHANTSEKVEIGPEIDISPDGDGSVIKRLKRETKHEIKVRPQLGDQVKIHYVAMYGKDGVLFDSSRKLVNSGGYSFKVGDSKPMKDGMIRPKGLDIAVKQMYVGECALVTIQSKYAFGQLGVRVPPRPSYTVPPNTYVVYNIDIIECGKAIENMTSDEKMKKAAEYTHQGTKHFKDKEYNKAIAIYELALNVLQEYPNIRHDNNNNNTVDVINARREIVRCLSNIATSQFKAGISWKDILKNCDQAIWVHDGGNVNDDKLLSKVLYRRAEIYVQRSETLKARQDLERAYVCAPDSKSVSFYYCCCYFLLLFVFNLTNHHLLMYFHSLFI